MKMLDVKLMTNQQKEDYGFISLTRKDLHKIGKNKHDRYTKKDKK